MLPAGASDYVGHEVKDWRGTPIVPGALVIYGAGVGRSIALVEAEVAELNPEKGTVKLKVIRRGYGGGTQDYVRVGANRLVVVNDLPPTEIPTQNERNAEATRRMEEHDRVEKTHAFPEYRYMRWNDPNYFDSSDRVCTKCAGRYGDVMYPYGSPQECVVE
jgi:hypothetical protein